MEHTHANPLFTCSVNTNEFSTPAKEVIESVFESLSDLIINIYSIIGSDKSIKVKDQLLEELDFSVVDRHKLGEQIRDSIMSREGWYFDNELTFIDYSNNPSEF